MESTAAGRRGSSINKPASDLQEPCSQKRVNFFSLAAQMTRSQLSMMLYCHCQA